MTDSELEKRKNVALSAIKEAFGSPADEFGATLFVLHHLEEIDDDYWTRHLGSSNPEPHQVLDLLECVPPEGEEDSEELMTLDFTLPGNATNYVIAVAFDDDGNVDTISMES